MTDPVDIAVGDRIRQLRKARGITQTELASAIGLTFQQVQKYEKARNRISASKLAKIATIFDVDVAELFRGQVFAANGNIDEGDMVEVKQLLSFVNEMPTDVNRHFKDLLLSIADQYPQKIS